MMPYTCKVILGAGLWLTLGLTGDGAQADNWYREHGLASYYGKGFHGRKAADGDRFSQNEMTAAHRHLPLGTKVMVENRATGEQVEVKITDRGPYADPKRRIIDLSKAAADSIGLVEQGVGPVRVVITEEAANEKSVPRSRSSMRSRWEPLNTRPTPRQCWSRYRTGFPKRTRPHAKVPKVRIIGSG